MPSRLDAPDPILDPARTAVMGTDWLPGYELLSVVGSGGFGTIFKARQIKLDRVVALKVVGAGGGLDPSAVERFEAEAITHGRLHHPNIVEVYDSGRHGDRMFIAMELLEGEDLGRCIQRTGPLPERVAWGIARQTAAALAYAASSGLVHRDIKPANLFLTPAPSGIGLPPGVPLVKVTDFGLALTRWVAGRAAPERKSTGILLGTPLYMAPEQYRRPEEIDHRADIYALGATVVHAITGRPPFRGGRGWETLEPMTGSGLLLDPPISPESARLLVAMMAEEPKDRPSSHDDLIRCIDRLPVVRDGDRPALVAPATIQSVFRRMLTRTWPLPVVVPAAAAAAAAVIAAVAVLGDNPRTGRRSHPTDGIAVRYLSTGDHLSLFDGATLRDWLPPASGGVWRVATDEEFEPVLIGTGFTRRAFPRFENYRLTLGVDVHEAAATEVHFAIPAAAPDSGLRFVIQVSRTGGAVFGVREGDKDEFQPRGNPVPFPPPAWFQDRKPYLEVRVERTGTNWAVWFNGQPAGRGDDDGRPKSPELRVRATGGRARINSVFLTALKAQ